MKPLDLLYCLREYWIIMFCGFCGIYYDGKSVIMTFVFVIFTMTSPKPVVVDLMRWTYLPMTLEGIDQVKHIWISEGDTYPITFY